MNTTGDNSASNSAIEKAKEHPVSFAVDYPQNEEVHLRDYFNLLLKRKWAVITFFLVVVTTVLIGTFLMTPVYRATITIKIDKENPSVLNFKDIYGIQKIEDDYYQTQYKILKSRNLATRVIRSLKLEEEPEFAPKKDSRVKGASIGAVRGAAEDPVLNIVDDFLDRLTVEPLQKSMLVKVSFDSRNPELSANVANKVGKAYIDFDVASKFEATQQAREWLEKQLEDMKARVERADEALNRYAADKGIIFVSDSEGKKDEDKQNIITKKLGELSTQLVQAISDRIGKEALYRETLNGDSGDAESIPAVLNNPLIQSLKKDLAALEGEYSQLSKLYKPDYPKMTRLKEQTDQIRKRTDLETRKIISGIRRDYEAALKRESYLKSTMEKYKGEALNFNEKMVQYQILQREAQTNRELYNGLLQRLKEIGVSASLTASNIQVLDRAEVPKTPHKPKTTVNLLLAIIVGLFGGIGSAFFFEYIDGTVKAPGDIEKKISLPTLGFVPSFDSRGAKDRRILTLEDKRSPLAEAYRSIGTYIQFSSAVKPPKTMLVTSARRGEGKTTTSLNTAIALSQSHGKGIIIDADMRGPQLHKIFGVNNSRGLSMYLTGNMEPNKSLIQETKVANLDIITAGIIPPNPSELLSSYRMRDLIADLLPLYSFIIIDAPPVLGLSDSLVLSALTEGVIMIVRAGSTPVEAVAETKKLLRGMNAKILGVVVNDVKETQLKYSSYYYNYYHYGYYGADGKERKKRGGKNAE